MDRDSIFGETPKGSFMWCMHCERVYLFGSYRTLVTKELGEFGALQMCPFEDCDGDAVIDAKDWDWVRDCNPQYPETPEVGKVYPLYPES